ncbi:NAD(P)-binding protein [Xylariaceae sp. FL1651]|nr:NAD(P)-binding protein [Xylariaceae sp. FL1651]
MASPHPLSAAALFDLKGWVAVVTGGGTGVGLMIAQALAANGAKVYITGRRTDVLETSARVHGAREKLGGDGGEIFPLVMDVTDKESIKKTVSELETKEGCVNVLVNNAGIWKGRPAATPADGPEAFGAAMFAEDIEGNWQQTFLTNTTSPYFVTAAFLPLLAKAINSPAKQVGSVINNASTSGLFRMSQNCQYSYNVSKAAALHLTRQMAFDFSHESIRVRVNGIAIGYFPSEMTTNTSNENNESSYNVDVFRARMEAMGAKAVTRMGSARDLASVILTLVTNDYLWGTVTVLDGGFALNVPGNM